MQIVWQMLYNLQNLFTSLMSMSSQPSWKPGGIPPSIFFLNLKLREFKSLAEGHIVVVSRAENPNLGLGVIRVLINHTLVFVFLSSET